MDPILLPRNPRLTLEKDFELNIKPRIPIGFEAKSFKYGDENLGWELIPIPMLKKSKTGVCRDCQQRCVLRDNGTIPYHVLGKDKSCPGQGKRPVIGSYQEQLPSEDSREFRGNQDS